MCVILGCSRDAQDESGALLPSLSDLRGIKAVGGVQVYDRKSLFDYINGGADLYLEYGFTKTHVQRYTSPVGEVTLEIYEMDRPAHAYGIYSFDSKGEHPETIGEDATYAEGLLSFWKGRFFVRIFAAGEEARDVILDIGRRVSAKIPSEGSPPELLSLLPSSGVEPDTVIYFLGMIALNNAYFLAHQNVLSLGEGAAEGVTFAYTHGGGRVRAIIVRYGTSEVAKDVVRTLVESGILRDPVGDNVRAGKTRRGYGAATTRNGLVLVVLDAAGREQAAAALDSLVPGRGTR